MMAMHSFFFFNDTATTEIYTLSLHDALPISSINPCAPGRFRKLAGRPAGDCDRKPLRFPRDRKSTRLNSSHSQISYAVFCLQKKKNGRSEEPATHFALLVNIT